MCSADCFLAILAVLFPPIAVWVKRGICSADSIINIALLCLGYLPGLLHAWYIIANNPDPVGGFAGYGYEPIEGSSNQRVYYYTATYPSTASHIQPAYPAHHHPQCINSQPPRTQPPCTRDYGTTTVNSSSPATETTAVEQPKPDSHAQTQLVVDGMSRPGDASSSTAGPSQAPPSYSDVVKGDYKVQSS